MGSTYQSTVISANADDVWNTLRNFHDMSWAPNVVESCNPTGSKKGTEAGAKRILNGAFHETLHDLNDEEKVLTYSIDDGPKPISKDDVDDYIGTVTVRPVTDSNESFVEWASEWKKNDEAAEEFCTTVYTALLTELKNHFS